MSAKRRRHTAQFKAKVAWRRYATRRPERGRGHSIVPLSPELAPQEVLKQKGDLHEVVESVLFRHEFHPAARNY